MAASLDGREPFSRQKNEEHLWLFLLFNSLVSRFVQVLLGIGNGRIKPFAFALCIGVSYLTMTHFEWFIRFYKYIGHSLDHDFEEKLLVDIHSPIAELVLCIL